MRPEPRPVSFGPARFALGFLLILLGIESVVQMVTDWTVDGGLTITTGLLLVVGGAGVFVGSGRALSIAAWAIRFQLVVSVAIGVLATWAVVSAGVASGSIPLAGLVSPFVVGCVYIAACIAALFWIRRARTAEPVRNSS